MDTLSQATVTTRKAHKCWGCTREMPTGTRMTVIVNADAGQLTRTYWCRVCDATILGLPRWAGDDGWDCGDVKQGYPDEWAAALAAEAEKGEG